MMYMMYMMYIMYMMYMMARVKRAEFHVTLAREMCHLELPAS